MHEEVYDIDCRILMDIVTSLVILNRKPFTLYKYIFTYRFFAEVKEVTGEEYDLLISQINHFEDCIQGYLVTPDLYHLSFNFKPKEPCALIYSHKHRQQSEQYKKQCEVLGKQLGSIFGPQNVQCNSVVDYGIIDFTFGRDLSGRRSQFVGPETNREKGFAVLILDPESFCMNQPDRVLGKEVAYARHLRLSGYFTILVRTEDFEQTNWELPEHALMRKLKSLNLVLTDSAIR